MVVAVAAVVLVLVAAALVADLGAGGCDLEGHGAVRRPVGVLAEDTDATRATVGEVPGGHGVPEHGVGVDVGADRGRSLDTHVEGLVRAGLADRVVAPGVRVVGDADDHGVGQREVQAAQVDLGVEVDPVVALAVAGGAPRRAAGARGVRLGAPRDRDVLGDRAEQRADRVERRTRNSAVDVDRDRVDPPGRRQGRVVRGLGPVAHRDGHGLKVPGRAVEVDVVAELGRLRGLETQAGHVRRQCARDGVVDRHGLLVVLVRVAVRRRCQRDGRPADDHGDRRQKRGGKNRDPSQGGSPFQVRFSKDE